MKNNNKIAIVSSSLGLGGAERFASLLSIMLTEAGYDIHNIIIEDFVAYEIKGELLNLGSICQNDNAVFRKFKKGFILKKYLNTNNISIVIDNRSRPTIIREFFAKWVYKRRKVIYMIHISKLEMYLSSSVFFAQKIYGNAFKLVCVSKSIEAMVNQKYQLQNTQTLYNPMSEANTEWEKPTTMPAKYFIYFGRLEEEQKNFNLMLTAFQKSEVYKHGCHLIIMGDGPSKDELLAKIKSMNLTAFVQLIPFQQQVLPFVQHAVASLLTSRYEGFPMSIVESLSVQTPVISVDCETGPREIIQNKINGLLVENHNAKALAEAMSLMIEDENLYQNCKNNTKKSVEHLSLATITQQWQNLLKAND